MGLLKKMFPDYFPKHIKNPSSWDINSEHRNHQSKLSESKPLEPKKEEKKTWSQKSLFQQINEWEARIK